MDGERRFIRENKDKNPWLYTPRSYGEDYISAGLLGGFSWPPRSYTCSFCRREFRSAQALGGHMNVHRRERARLRQSPPWEGHASSPNPNPSPPSSSPLANASPPVTYNFPSLLSSSLTRVSSFSASSSSPCKERILPLLDPPGSPSWAKDQDVHLSRTPTAKKALFGAGDLKGFAESGEEEYRKKGDIATLDLDIGLSTDGIADPTEELDLELRLGYS